MMNLQSEFAHKKGRVTNLTKVTKSDRQDQPRRVFALKVNRSMS